MVLSKRFFNRLLFIVIAVLLASCTNIIRTTEESSKVRFVFDTYRSDNRSISDSLQDCIYLGEVVGSEGHWYTYLFISNEHLTHGALNDLRNQAHALGGDTVLVLDQIEFRTSVTYIGQAFNCGGSKP